MTNISNFFDVILSELEYRSGKIPDLKDTNQINLLSEILVEYGYGSISHQLIKNLSEDNEFTTPILNKEITYKNAKGDDVKGTVGYLIRQDKESDGYKKALALIKANDSKLYNQIIKGSSPTEKEDTSHSLVNDVDYQSHLRRTGEIDDTPITVEDIISKNTESLNRFIDKGTSETEAAPGKAGSMLNEIMSVSTTSTILNQKAAFDIDSELEKAIIRLKDSNLGKENNKSKTPISGVTAKDIKPITEKFKITNELASKALVAVRAARGKTNHIRETIINKNNITEFNTIPFFGDKSGLKNQEDFVRSYKGKIKLGNTLISKEDAINIIKNSGKGENPSDTAIFINNSKDNVLHMVFFSDKDNVDAIIAQSSIKAEVKLKTEALSNLVSDRILTNEQSKNIADIMEKSIDNYAALEAQLDTVTQGPAVHLKNVDTEQLIKLAKKASKGASPDIYWKDIVHKFNNTAKYIKYLPIGHATPPTDTEIMAGFIEYINNPGTTLIKLQQKLIVRLSNATNGPRLGAQIGNIRKQTIATDLSLINTLNETKIKINNKEVGLGTYLEAISVSGKLHLNMMYGGDGIYSDEASFYQENGGVKVDKNAMKHCFPFEDKNDMLSHFEVGTEKEQLDRAGIGVTGSTKIIYAISKNNQRYPIAEKRQRSKQGPLGKLQTVYKYHKNIQNCFKSYSDENNLK